MVLGFDIAAFQKFADDGLAAGILFEHVPLLVSYKDQKERALKPASLLTQDVFHHLPVQASGFRDACSESRAKKLGFLKRGLGIQVALDPQTAIVVY